MTFKEYLNEISFGKDKKEFFSIDIAYALWKERNDSYGDSASNRAADTLEKYKELMRHTYYSIKDVKDYHNLSSINK